MFYIVFRWVGWEREFRIQSWHASHLLCLHSVCWFYNQRSLRLRWCLITHITWSQVAQMYVIFSYVCILSGSSTIRGCNLQCGPNLSLKVDVLVRDLFCSACPTWLDTLWALAIDKRNRLQQNRSLQRESTMKRQAQQPSEYCSTSVDVLKAHKVTWNTWPLVQVAPVPNLDVIKWPTNKRHHSSVD